MAMPSPKNLVTASGKMFPPAVNENDRRFIVDEPLELCDKCKSRVTYQYDFNKRCCRARHTLELDRPRREAQYARLLETKGREYVNQRIADVKAPYLYRQGFPKSAGSQ
jgi:hypothetical protein